MTDESAFIAALDADNDSSRGPFADWLEEEGDPRQAAYRWMHTHGKRPYTNIITANKSKGAAWMSARINKLRGWEKAEVDYAIIPERMFRLLREFEPVVPYRWFDSRQAAEDAFCKAYLAVQSAADELRRVRGERIHKPESCVCNNCERARKRITELLAICGEPETEAVHVEA